MQSASDQCLCYLTLQTLSLQFKPYLKRTNKLGLSIHKVWLVFRNFKLLKKGSFGKYFAESKKLRLEMLYFGVLTLLFQCLTQLLYNVMLY